ncbi:phosphoglycolate phosphatase [Microvirga puerhi]|uniref:Phosphoglycolate phosphatase n=1 Tax=Microvirga puerhi TaxID=2876078 RepID=A0ABS7VJV6_9HYPH|nr:phosphoglycolate phosphatase [Microvirga puerhi]MBZ6075813.1 phosphoglycolate phosphatase [Microvirga puerhi]
MTPVKAILFDLDGTLVDSARDLQSATNALLAGEGLREISLGETKAMVGDGVTKLVERALLATGGDVTRLAALTRRFLEIYEANPARHTRSYPGVQGVLEDLHRCGLRLGVVTNKPLVATMDILKALGLADFFGVVVAGDVLAERKPHPAPLLHALERLDISPGEALMVGDNYHDVQAARAAGMRIIAVTYGYSHKPHSDLGADALIATMPDLLAILKDGLCMNQQGRM